MTKYDDDADRFGDDDEDGTNVECNRCGKRGLDWVFTGVRWRLMEGMKFHACSPAATPDDFEVLP